MIARWIKSITAPEKFLVLTLLVFGSIACLSIPLSAGYDEETHFVRAWEMAHLYFIPNQQLGAKLLIRDEVEVCHLPGADEMRLFVVAGADRNGQAGDRAEE